jgi:ribose-phosphate pyrophosphokinase
MTPLLVAIPGNERLAEDLAAMLRCDVGGLEIRAFPDGETYLRFLTSPAGRSVGIVCTLARPNEKLLPVCTENLNPDVVVMKSAKDRI